MSEPEAAKLSHLNEAGEANMVDVSAKEITTREAIAQGEIKMAPATLARLLDDDVPKGDVFATARIAGIMAAKKTHDLIPLCHPLPLAKISISFETIESLPGVRVEALARLAGRTGVEMEALTAVSLACLTLYDMLKAIDKEMEIQNIYLKSKTGGRSGDFSRKP